MNENKNRRILIIDDQDSIREDFKKILGDGESESSSRSDSARAAFFGAEEEVATKEGFELEFASQGDIGVQTLQRGVDEGRPFAMAFVDIRMPPGPDGLVTIKELWQIDPDLEVVICTAYSDYSFDEIVGTCGETDRLLILKKPFDPVEVRQLAGALCAKWNVVQGERARLVELEEANARADAANRAKSQFLANMSHEIRTPMNAILGYLDFLIDPETSPEEKEQYAETVRKSGRHLLTILDDILDISSIEARRMNLATAEVDPFALAGDVVELLRSQAEEKDLEISLELRGPVPASVQTDGVRVRQILLNLLGNAVKFTTTGSVKLVLEGRHAGRDSDVARLSFAVMDTGPGIAPEEIEHLFDAFHQADDSMTRASGGTGLGLTISKRLANLLEGDVTAKSKPGEGSTFEFILPIGPESEVEWTTPAPRDAEPATSKAQEQKSLDARVLVVEDVRVNQVLIAAMLRKAGAQVTLASDGRAGCDAVQKASDDGEPFDLICMDMQMPVLDGYSATRELRAAGYDLPIVALTAHAMTGDRERCLEAGCSGYLTKPIDRSELLSTCRSLLVDGPPAPLPTPERDPSTLE